MKLTHLVTASSLAVATALTGPPVQAQDGTGEQNQNQNQQQSQRERNARTSATATHTCDICGLTVKRTAGPSGLLVTEVEDGSPADEAGLQEGDLVMRVSQMDPDSPESLSEWMQRAQQPNQSSDARLRIRRNGRARLVTLNLPPADGAEEQEGRNEGAGENDSSRQQRERQARLGDRGRDDAQDDRLFDGRIRERLSDRFGESPSSEQAQQDVEAGLGVGVDETPRDGVVVRYVYQGSPAARAGIRVGDRVVALNDQAIRTTGQLVDRIRSMNPEREVVLTVVREGEREQLDVVLGERPEALQGRILASRRGRIRARDRGDRMQMGRPVFNDDTRGQSGRVLAGIREELRQLRQEVSDLRRELDQSQGRRNDRE